MCTEHYLSNEYRNYESLETPLNLSLVHPRQLCELLKEPLHVGKVPVELIGSVLDGVQLAGDAPDLVLNVLLGLLSTVSMLLEGV